MKKQIALFATILVTAGFSAFGQGYVNLDTSTRWVWDEFTTPGVGGNSSADMDVAFLWAASGTADQLASVGTQFGLGGTNVASAQVATNGVASVGTANPVASINTMLAGGWNWVTNDYAATPGFGTEAITLTSTKGAIAYTGGSSGTTIQVLGSGNGQTIELVAIAWNATASSESAASDLGWSNPFNYTTGASSTDTAGTVALSSEGMNQFGVAAVPEPTTLALAGLGGLSMLFLRRRKA